MIGCLRTHVRKQLIIAHCFEFETVVKFYNLKASFAHVVIVFCLFFCFLLFFAYLFNNFLYSTYFTKKAGSDGLSGGISTSITKKTQYSGPSSICQWRFASGPMVAQHWILAG